MTSRETTLAASRLIGSGGTLKSRLQWPLKEIEITSGYGKRARDFHEGIDLKAKEGTAVFSAEAGKVVYAGSKIRGYGNLVVIRHISGVTTIYAHNSRMLVKKGQKVAQGQHIADSGRTGHVSGPHLHFEVRRGLNPLDPIAFLPRASEVQVARRN